MEQFLGRQFDKEDEFGNYEFAMHLGEILTEPTGEDDITAEIPKEDFPVFFDREGEAYMSFEYFEKNKKYLI
jgi:hypothetical protein